MKMLRNILFFLCLLVYTIADGQDAQIELKIDELAAAIEPKLIEWRRDFHQHPELSGQEFRTAQKVAEHLRALGLDVQTGIAKTGVVAILRGQNPTPVVALRSDMDALPITENTGLPFASKVKAVKNGDSVGVMHACGHDTHTAILMSVAQILVQLKDKIPGTVKFIFQPAEEAAGGADEMVAAGVLENPNVDAIIALHISSQIRVGEIHYRSGGFMASSDYFNIIVTGKQTHGAMPWLGTDPIVVSAQIVLGLQNIISRQIDVTQAPALITIGKIHGGVRSNIIPGKVELAGTIRALDEKMRLEIHEKVRVTATNIAESAGATADVRIRQGTPVLHNNVVLCTKLLPSLVSVVGQDKVIQTNASTVSEDFAFFLSNTPGFYFLIGGMPPDASRENAPAHHSSDFKIDESGMLIGVRALCQLVMEY